MAINYKPVDEIPETAGRRGPRDSECMRAYQQARATPSKKVQVQTDSREELERFYKSMIQWRNRHRDTNVEVKKDGDAVYVWIRDEDE